MPGTGRTLLEFGSVLIWIVLGLFVLRILVDLLASKFPNPITAAMLTIISNP